MYSDVIDPLSQDCVAYSDQPSSYNMADMNEIGNQTNLDYFLDSLYPSVSNYNTDFEFREDCKNMSFSELFDQELFSSQENKDCKITIKIENEELSQSCYSNENTQDTIYSQPSVKIEETVPSSLIKRFSPKRGINRTSIRTTNNCDVQSLIYNPFCEVEDFRISEPYEKINMSIVKHEPVDVNDTVEQNIVGIQEEPCYSDNLQNTTNNLSFEKVEDNGLFPLIKSSGPKHQGINRTFIKTNSKLNVQQLMYNPFCEKDNFTIDESLMEVQIPNVKHEPEHVNNTECFSTNLQNTVSQSLVKVEEHFSSLSKYSTSKCQCITNTSKGIIDCLVCCNTIKSQDIDQTSMTVNTPIVKCESKDVNDIIEERIVGLKVKPNLNSSQNTTNYSMVKVEEHFSSLSKCQCITNTSKGIIDCLVCCDTTKNQNIDQTSATVNTPIIKRESKDVNDTVQENIVGLKVKPNLNNLQNKTNYSMVKVEEHFSSSLSNNSVSKYQFNDMASKIYNIDNNEFNKTSEIVKLPIVKVKTQDINNTIKQNIVRMKVEPCSDNSQNATSSHSFVNIKKNILSSSSNNLAPNHKFIDNGTPIENIKNVKVNQPFCETQNIGIDQMSLKVKFPNIKCEPNVVGKTIEQNVIEMDIKTENRSMNEFGCVDLNNASVEKKEIVIVNKENVLFNETSLKNDNVCSQTLPANNQIKLETEKKKISWEEYRAKRGKFGLLKTSENKRKVDTLAIDEVDNDQLEAMTKEFDRNTAEYFIDKKRKIDDREENTTAKAVSNVEDQELEKKRMKIEYIKKLLPSSFASEIAKTSSFMKGNLEIENEITSDDSVMSNDKIHTKYADTYGDSGYFRKGDKSQKKDYISRIHLSRHNSNSDYSNRSSRSSSTSSSNPDDYYNRNRIDTVQKYGQYGQNIRNNTLPRSNEQKKVVYIGQIPIRFGKRYLYNRFKEFGKIQSLTLHKKPDFRVYYAFVTYSEVSEAERAISHGNQDKTQVQFDIRFGERKQAQTPYYDLDDEWLTDWYGYNQPLAIMRKPQSREQNVSFEEELEEFYKLTQIKKLNQKKSSSQFS